MKNTGKKKVILDLCGGTGSWSLPYKEAGYQVINVTLPKYDVTDWLRYDDITGPVLSGEVYGILSAPPCPMFSFARTNAKKPRDLRGGFDIVHSCLSIIWNAQYRPVNNTAKYTRLKFWALENPYYGLLRNFLGKPVFDFNPYDFGHNYQKKTALWGHFNEPKKKPIKMSKKQKELAKTNSQPMPKFDYMKSKDIAPDWFGKLDRKARRAITPRGFAEAFYKVNK